MTVQPGLYRTWSEAPKTGFLIIIIIIIMIMSLTKEDAKVKYTNTTYNPQANTKAYLDLYGKYSQTIYQEKKQYRVVSQSEDRVDWHTSFSEKGKQSMHWSRTELKRHEYPLASVCPLSVARPYDNHVQRYSPAKPLIQLFKQNFMCSIHGRGWVLINGSGHVSKMAVTPIYGKFLWKCFSSDPDVR